MDAERRERIEALFDEALDRPEGEREAWLASACRQDAALLAEVRALLDAHARAEGILENDAVPRHAARLADQLTAPGGPRHAASPAPPVYDRIGPYRIVGELGRGGMGVVYIGERDDGQFRMRVAIKVIGGGPDPWELRARFEAERQILAALDHPYIAKLLDGGLTPDGHPYLVMEYIDGRPIDVFCDEKRLSVEERLQLFAQVARAVHHAHGRLVVHRDLKPSNILVTAEGVPKLLDFGIAKILSPAAIGTESAPITRTGLRLMTPEYASPEQVRGEAATTSNDVWGLGVVLFELMTGRRPFPLEGRTPLECERLITEAAAPRPSTVIGQQAKHGPRIRARSEDGRDSIGVDRDAHARRTTAERLERRLRGDVDRIVLVALRKEAERRYQSALALAEDVERHLEGRPVAAQGDSIAYRARKFVLRYRWAVGAAAILVLSLVGGLIGVSWQARVAESERDRATAEAEKAEAVAALMLDLFRLSDPNESLGDTITARQVLDEGAARIEREFGDQPDVQATLLSEVARVYANLGILSRAESLVRDALALRGTLYGPGSLEVSESLGQLGDVLAARGDRPAAVEQYRRAIAIREDELAQPDTLVAQYQASLAWELRALGDHGAAAALFENALATQRALLGEDRPAVAITLLGLASSYHEQGAFDRAEQLFQRALASRDSSARPHPLAATALLNIGMIRRIREQYAQAEPLLENALAMRRTLYDADHPAVLEAIEQWGALQQALGRYADAERTMRAGLARAASTLGSDHPTAIGLREGLAAALADLARYDESIAHYDSLLAVKAAVYESDHPSVVYTLTMSGEPLLGAGQWSAAEQRYEAALAMGTRVSGPQSVYRILQLQGLARIAIERGQLARAETLYAEARTLADSLLRPDHRYSLALERDRATLATLRGHASDAIARLESVYAAQQKSTPSPHPNLARTLNALAAAQIAAGDSAAAILTLRRARTESETLPRTHPAVRDIERKLGELNR